MMDFSQMENWINAENTKIVSRVGLPRECVFIMTRQSSITQGANALKTARN